MAKQVNINTREPSFSPEALAQIIRSNPELLKSVFQSINATSVAVKTDQAVTRAFEKAGYKNIVLFDRSKTLADQANVVTILTYKRWLELGRVVKKGEKSIKARKYHIRLFHRDQTEPASVAQLPVVSPVEAPKRTKAKPSKGKIVPPPERPSPQPSA